MATNIDPKLFSRIMALPKAVRLDVLEFAGSSSVGPTQLDKIVDDLLSQPVDPGKDSAVNVA
jgi:hypothetical protein